MALYVTVCLLAALTALQNVVAVPGRVLGLVWGTTIGLALAHLFAFRIAGRLVQDGRLAKGDQNRLGDPASRSGSRCAAGQHPRSDRAAG